MIDEKALYQALKEVKECVMMTSQGTLEMQKYLETGDISVFSAPVLHELSLLYSNIILPAYMHASGGKYLPNIFVKLED